MELIVIDETKLKIMLTAPDMHHYDLRAERMSTADEQTRAAFRHIFDDARTRIGFDTEGERLFVQLYASRSGGCEIFVTKLGLSDPPTPLDPADEALLARLYADHPKQSLPPHPMTYRFATLSDLLALCRRLRAAGFDGQSTATLAETRAGKHYYLILTATEPSVLREYAEEIPDPTHLNLYLAEHGHPICPDSAVETLGVL